MSFSALGEREKSIYLEEGKLKVNFTAWFLVESQVWLLFGLRQVTNLHVIDNILACLLG